MRMTTISAKMKKGLKKKPFVKYESEMDRFPRGLQVTYGSLDAAYRGTSHGSGSRV